MIPMWFVCDTRVVHVSQTREGNHIVGFEAVTQSAKKSAKGIRKLVGQTIR